ncbi:MAG: glycosyltransferase family 4 protein [Pyrinomonadaceae bacterium]|nr:glycosyltransferase family 4 protein [Pyrinomonadaceae bacterium]
MAELVGSQMSGEKNRKKIFVIPNWASLEEVEPLPRASNELLKELRITDKFVFLYAGNMGHPQDLETIVRCAAELKNDDRFHFLFIGSGVKKKWLEKEIETHRMRNVSVLPPRPRGEQKFFLNACDVGLVALVKKMYGVAMPSRTYNLLAAGKPILALTEDNSEVARVIDEEKVGWTVAPRDAEKLLKTIYKIYEERENLPAIGIRARQAALENYSVETAIEKYRQVLSR